MSEEKKRAYASNLDHIFKQEEVSLKDYESFADVEANLTIFIEQVYHTKRLHSSLGYMPPAEFEEYEYLTSSSESMMALTMIQILVVIETIVEHKQNTFGIISAVIKKICSKKFLILLL